MARKPQRRNNRPRQGMDAPSRTVTVAIDHVGARGDSIARDGDDLLYVPYGVPGDLVTVKTMGRQGDGVAAAIAEILTPSPLRVAPLCGHFGICGGCALQQLESEAYAAWKVGLLTAPLKRVGIDLPPAPLLRVPLGQRRRAQFAFINRRGISLLGFHERAAHRVVDLEQCPVLLPEIVAALPPLRALLGEVVPDGGGEVTISATETGLDVLVEGELKLDLFIREKLAQFAADWDLGRLSWVRPGGEVEPVARRRGPLVRFGQAGVEPPPGSFIQPTALGERAIAQAILAAVPPGGKVADLYAGCGSFSIPLAERGAQVHAVEGDELPMRALSAAANRAGLAITVETRDLARRPLLPHELKAYKAVVFDPPRAGAADQVEQLVLGGPPIVVAVSCNPNTLARDLNVLIDGGYALRSIAPIDQFPFAAHLETVAVLER